MEKASERDPNRGVVVSRNVRLVLLLVVVAGLVATAAGITYSAFNSTTTNPPNSFSAATSFCTRSSAVWLTGFESGAVSTAGGGIFTTMSATLPTADNATLRNGSYSLRIADASGASTVFARKTFTATGIVVARFAVRLASLPGVDSNLAYVDSGTDLVFGYDTSSQKFTVTVGASTAQSANTVSAGSWYVIDLRYDLRANPHLGDWRIDGVNQGQVTRAAAATTANAFAFGATANPSVYTANFDDLFVADQATAYPIGDGRIVPLLLNGVGTHNTPGNFRDNDGTAIDASSWQRLDEVPMTVTTDYVRQQTNGGTTYLEFTFANTAETCIRDVSAVLAYHSATNTANNGKTSVFDGGSESIVFSGDMSNTAIQYKSTIATPATAPWGQAAVDGLVARVGFSTDANPNPYWDAILLEVAAA
jgi:hypothetical protein